MAYLNPNANKAPAPLAPVPGGAPVSAGGAGIGGSTKPSASAPGVNVPAQPSAQLSAYLGANKPQAAQFGGNIANTLGAQTQAAGNAIQPAVDIYSGQQYTVPTNEAVNTQLSTLSNPSTQPSSNGVANGKFVLGQPETGPASLTKEQQDIFKQELGASSKSPNPANTFETSAPYAGLQTGVQNAVQQANLWNSGNNVANLTTALNPFEGANATTGGKTLDALLLSQTPGAYGQIQKAVAPAAGLQGQLTAGTNQANQAMQNAIATNAATTPAAQAAAQAYAKNLTDYLTNAVSQAQGQAGTSNARIMADLQSGNLTPQDLAALNITPEQQTLLSNQLSAPVIPPPVNIAPYSGGNGGLGATIAQPSYGALPTAPNLSAYLTQHPTSEINAGNLATSQNYADVASLQDLMGGNAPVTPISGMNASQAGTTPNLNTYNIEQALKGASDYQNAVNAAGYQNTAQQLADQNAPPGAGLSQGNLGNWEATHPGQTWTGGGSDALGGLGSFSPGQAVSPVTDWVANNASPLIANPVIAAPIAIGKAMSNGGMVKQKNLKQYLGA